MVLPETTFLTLAMTGFDVEEPLPAMPVNARSQSRLGFQGFVTSIAKQPGPPAPRHWTSTVRYSQSLAPHVGAAPQTGPGVAEPFVKSTSSTTGVPSTM